MELKEFIKETLVDIVQGVRDAKTSVQEDIGRPSEICPKLGAGGRSGAGSRNLTDTMVEFDIALTSTEAGGKKGGIGVFLASVSVGGQVTSKTQTGSLSRIKFDVLVRFH